MIDLAAAYCRLVVQGLADDEILRAIAERMTEDEKARAFRRLIEETDIKVCMEALSAWRAAGGRWLHS